MTKLVIELDVSTELDEYDGRFYVTTLTHPDLEGELSFISSKLMTKVQLERLEKQSQPPVEGNPIATLIGSAVKLASGVSDLKDMIKNK